MVWKIPPPLVLHMVLRIYIDVSKTTNKNCVI